MKLAKLSGALLAASCAFTLPALGCYGSESAYIASDEPPAPRDEAVVERPGYFYIHGHWSRDGGNWQWQGGRYERQRAGFTYNEGRWERHGKGYHYVEGGWRAHGGVTVR